MVRASVLTGVHWKHELVFSAITQVKERKWRSDSTCRLFTCLFLLGKQLQHELYRVLWPLQKHLRHQLVPELPQVVPTRVCLELQHLNACLSAGPSLTPRTLLRIYQTYLPAASLGWKPRP